MHNLEKLLDSYDITLADIHNIKETSDFLMENRPALVENVMERLIDNKETEKYFKNEKILKKAKSAMAEWADDFAVGEYSEEYFNKLTYIGHTYANLGLPEHVANSTISYVRSFLTEKILIAYGDSPVKAFHAVTSINKALDLNLDLMTRSCHEEELNAKFLTHRLDSKMIQVSRWFVNGLNMVLIIGLMIIGVVTVIVCANDIYRIATEETALQHGALGALGSILILWVIIELLDTQIGHIKGHAFAIKVFVTVALVAELRRVLISSIEHVGWQEHAVIAGSVLILGYVYWLVSKVDAKK